jgi:hypothetical protein
MACLSEILWSIAPFYATDQWLKTYTPLNSCFFLHNVPNFIQPSKDAVSRGDTAHMHIRLANGFGGGDDFFGVIIFLILYLVNIV